MLDAKGDLDQASQPRLDLGRAPYVLYGVKHIDLVSLGPSWSSAGPVAHILTRPANPALTWVVRPMFCMVLNV